MTRDGKKAPKSGVEVNFLYYTFTKKSAKYKYLVHFRLGVISKFQAMC